MSLWAGAALALAALLALWSAWIEPRRLHVRRFEVPLPGLSHPVRAVAIGDLQPYRHHWPPRRLRAAFAAAQAERPDIVLWLGDYYNAPTKGMGRLLARAPSVDRLYRRSLVPMDAIAAEMGRLTAPMGAYAVLGNHDWGWSGEACAQALERAGVRVLIGEAAEAIHPGTGARLAVIGLDDASSDRPTGWARVSDHARAPCVVLSHAPDVWDALTPPPALTLSGHTHGGQIAPWPIGATRLPAMGRRYVRGWFRRGDARLYVTTGLGTSGPPLRLGAPPEIVVLELTPVESASRPEGLD
ncbi:metallophosphoesterase [Rubrimonas sp.]|uniref:metallophosphoesterase n=1 Tax=Rubrimonas sp. TaxID=2036015 RepID=UPI002FDF0468